LKLVRFIAILGPALLLFALTGVGGTRAESVAPSLTKTDDGVLKPRTRVRAQLNIFQQRAIDAYLSGRPVQPLDTLRVIALQVQFSDSLMGGQEGSRRPELHDSTYFANELRHLEQYYDGASRKHLTVAWEVDGNLYTMPEAMGYYGNDAFEDMRVPELMQTAIDSADDYVDFSQYDAFMLIHAGAGQETDILDNSRQQIFSSFYDRADIQDAFPDSTVIGLSTSDSLNGEPFFVDNFLCVPEDAGQDNRRLGSLGIWAFVTGSRLGLLPLFDSEPGGFPDSRGIGDFGLMSTGLFNAEGFIPAFPAAFNRLIAGWINPVLVEGDGQYRLRDINSPVANDTAMLRIPITENEYYLVVNRVHDTNFDSLFTFTDFDTTFPENVIPDNTDSLDGAEFDWFVTDFTNPFLVHFDPNVGADRRFVVTGSGLYIWHIDENVVRQNADQGYLPNDFVSHKGVDLEEADSVQDLDTVFFPFSFGSHFDSFREGNATTFGPDTKPPSTANSGAFTGITVTDISAADSFMTCAVQISKPYSETRTRWQAPAPFQPPSPFNLDSTGDLEIVVLADTGAVYVLTADGEEFLDRDNDPSTIAPYFTAPGAVWRGAPAFGDIDGAAGDELVASSQSGVIYAWAGSADTLGSAQVYSGAPIAAPPMLVDVDATAALEITVVELMGDTIEVGFVDGLGAKVAPSDPAVQGLWPTRIQAQYCAPLAFGAAGGTGDDTEGVVIAWADTIRGVYGLTYCPVRVRTSGGGRWEATIDARGGVNDAFPPTSTPAVGDLDGDGFDEVVVTLSDSRLVVWRTQPVAAPDSPQPPSLAVIELRAPNPSAPSIGDVDGNGTQEIALWDEENYYLFEHNARFYTNWPKPVRPVDLGDFPPLSSQQPAAGPLIADIDSDDRVDILFPRADGSVHAFHVDGGSLSGWPRTAPAGVRATPALSDLNGDDGLSLVHLGVVPFIGTVDAVSDTIQTDDTMVLAIQSLPGSSVQDAAFWSMYQHDLARGGRVTESNPLETKRNTFDESTFIVYPNPVRGNEVHARIILNQSATVDVEIYNLEGERAISQAFSFGNIGGVVQTPFDEIIDVSALKSGVYLLRMRIQGSGATEALVKTFAIVR
jgi:M6 family metalloprotease-like protein